MAPAELLFLIVIVGAFAQAVTGVGVGVIAGPFLLQAHGYQQGMLETAALCLITSVICAVKTGAAVDKRAFIILCAGLVPGVLLATALAHLVEQRVLILTFGVMLIMLGLSLIQKPTKPNKIRRHTSARGVIGAASVLAGGSAYLFATPGPLAAWGLARVGLDAAAMRATLSLYFILAYAAVLAVMAAINAPQAALFSHLALSGPAALLGAFVGLTTAAALPQGLLRYALAALIIIAGGSLLMGR